ncbi:AI-2E family transporter [Gilvimarinus agarilyticus]|uniref:AI-2E family transporter n=1 Tax=unclassified Gilvimarinus TaxID=2642066 RepID=UPI001C0930D0|nr:MULTISPECIES: AI-2E family transporter [unclassified Gilvimarinus]MBU2885315.1 AI-2E family transporter [Gilvimarinus agarilyticus]MDO6570214.1 AI-2E family transporter [Gilvimarinus sp. 2_MG-2023]MDO6748209.1 AI-2E family transporter [Gilvimarinus sp. 1_MG-2023]
MSELKKNLEIKSFLALLLIVSAAFLWILQPFFGPIFWACALAIIFHPIQTRLLKGLNHRPNSQALITLTMCLVIVIIPVIFLISSVVTQAADLYQKIESGEFDLAGRIEQFQNAYPAIQQTFERFGVNFSDLKNQSVDLAMNSGKFIAQYTFDIGSNAFKFVLDFCLMLYLTFFFLRDGNNIKELMVRALPMGDTRERLLFAKFAEVTRATVKGNLVVAMTQGALGGVIFWILGIPAALLWAVVMAFASLLPAIGAAIIWGPVAIYLLATGSYIQGIILVGFGAGVIGLVDNLLRPILVGRDTKLPDYIVLLSTLGGMALFGINGFVIGPLIAALFIAFWGIFMREINVDEDWDTLLIENDRPETEGTLEANTQAEGSANETDQP